MTLKGFLHVKPLKEESFSVLTLNLSLRRGPSSRICDITVNSEPVVVQYAAHTSVMWKPEASSAQTLRMDFLVN